MILKEKVVVITGASDGIGKEIALRLAKEGVKLALISRNESKLKLVSDECIKKGALDSKIYPVDITDTSKLTEVSEKILSDYKYVDVLINNAGIWQKLKPFYEIDPETIDKVIDTNLKALVHVTRLFIHSLLDRDEAAIINISSKSGVTIQPGQTVYSASKFGVRGFTDVLKVDLKDTNIKVAGIYQSGTKTKLFEKVGEHMITDNYTDPKDLADVIAYMLKQPKNIWLHDVRIDR